MANAKPDQIATLLELLKPKHDIVGDPDEYGMELIHKEGLYKVQVAQSGVTFRHPSNATLFYAYGWSHMQDIREFVKHPPSFDEALIAAAKAKPGRSSQSPGAPKGERGPSARGIIFNLLAKNTPQEDILKALAAALPDRDIKKLKTQIYLHRSEFNKKGAK